MQQKAFSLTTLLNATPGKRSYGVLYPDEKTVETWPEPMNGVHTAAFVKAPGQATWHGWLLSFDFEKARSMQEMPKFDFPVLDKLAMDLWFLDRLDQPEIFVSVVKEVELAHGMSPKTLLRPGTNPVELLGNM